jgi:hypothetical protein
MKKTAPWLALLATVMACSPAVEAKPVPPTGSVPTGKFPMPMVDSASAAPAAVRQLPENAGVPSDDKLLSYDELVARGLIVSTPK